MKIFKEIKQGTEEWKEIRHAKIGGTTAKKILTYLDKSVKNCSEYYSILSERMEDFDPFKSEYINSVMQRGNELEPIARGEYVRVTGINIEEYGWVESSETVGISPDGWNEKMKKGLEIKCPEASTHAKYLLNNSLFVDDYWGQIVHYFTVLSVDSVDCVSFRPENKIKPILIFTVTKETEVKISTKQTLTISDLIIIEEKRLEELETEIKKDIELLTKPKF